MYAGKFEEVLMISPSYAKMGLELKDDNVRTKFSLDWIFDRLN